MGRGPSLLWLFNTRHGARGVDGGLHRRFRPARAHSGSNGRSPAKAKVPGTQFQRHGLPSQPKNRVGAVGPRSRSVEHRTSSSSTGSSRRGQAEETKRKRRRLGKRGLLEGRPQRKVGKARRERQREERRPEGDDQHKGDRGGGGKKEEKQRK